MTRDKQMPVFSFFNKDGYWIGVGCDFDDPANNLYIGELGFCPVHDETKNCIHVQPVAPHNMFDAPRRIRLSEALRRVWEARHI